MFSNSSEQSSNTSWEDNSEPSQSKKARLMEKELKVEHILEHSSQMSASNSCLSSVAPSIEIEPCSSENRMEIYENSTAAINPPLNLQQHSDHQLHSLLLETEHIFDNLEQFDLNEESRDPTVPTNCECYQMQWHIKRMVRHDIENQINSVIEKIYKDSSSSSDHEMRYDGIEGNDESILMAINHYGLRPMNSWNNENIMEPSNDHSRDSSISSSESPEEVVESNAAVSSTDFWNTAVSTAISQKGLGISMT